MTTSSARESSIDTLTPERVLEIESQLWQEQPARQLDLLRELEAVGAAALPLLMQAAEEAKFRFRFVAVDALGKVGDESVAPLLMRATGDTDGAVRSAAMTALGRLRIQAAVPALLQCMSSPEHTVCISAANALGEIGHPSCVPALIDALQNPNAQIRSSVAGALGKLCDQRAVPALIDTLRDDRDEYTRCFAAEALGGIGDASAVSGLIEAVRDADEPVRSAAVLALGRLRDHHATPALIRTLEDLEEDDSPRTLAAHALVEIGAEEGTEALTVALDGDNPVVRAHAAIALDSAGKLLTLDPAPSTEYAPYNETFKSLRRSGAISQDGVLTPTGSLVEFVQTSALPTEAKVIDLRCGDGRNSVYLAKSGYRVTAVDPSPLAMGLAGRFARQTDAHVHFMLCAPGDLPEHLDESYDLAIDLMLLEMLLTDDSRSAYLNRVWRLLQPGGQFYLLDRAATPEGTTPVHGSIPICGRAPREYERELEDADFEVLAIASEGEHLEIRAMRGDDDDDLLLLDDDDEA